MQPHPELPQAFADLGLEVSILRGIHAVDYTEPTEIQKQVIPLILQGKDIFGQARTGTGKTGAFALPILQMIDLEQRLQAIVLAPTRELAAQVVGEFRRYAKYLDVNCVPVYGGTSIKAQVHQLGRRPHVVVGTPGRILDLMGRRVLNLDAIRVAVLDEVDRMLDIGFRDDIKRILGAIRHRHQTVFVSATIDDQIKHLASQFMHDQVDVNVSGDKLTVDEVRQDFCTVDPWDKARLLKMLLKEMKPKLAIVFCNTKHAARKLAKRLHAAGVEAKEIHGDLVQRKRERVMERFRRHRIPVLVATDLASRGIDVHEISHIINYDVPQDSEVYIHRIGRTARMGAVGRAITFVTREEGKELTAIEMLINQQISPLEIPGFEPSPPPRDGREAPSTQPAAAAADAPAGPVAPAEIPPVEPSAARPRTLGGKFPVPRRFRRR
ncbi:MAG: DEAD/DEAH box helicase [Planctomycetota bacterium]|nr:DEAD/DEAH box helicase [Planctomycetota bacterium]